MGAGAARLRNRFTNLSNGVEPPYFPGGCHQTNHRQKTGTMLANGHKGTKPASALAAAPTPLAICAWKQQFPVPCTSHRAVGFVYAPKKLDQHTLKMLVFTNR